MWLQQKDYKKVGAVLRAAREGAKISQVVLAKRLAKPQSFVSNCESGQRRVDLLELQRIASAIKTDPILLFTQVLSESLPKSQLKLNKRWHR